MFFANSTPLYTSTNPERVITCHLTETLEEKKKIRQYLSINFQLVKASEKQNRFTVTTITKTFANYFY